MSWLILLIASFISAALILYALWPKTDDHKFHKTGVILLAITVIILPAGLNYYNNIPEQPVSAVRESSFNIPDMKNSVWSGGSTLVQPTISKDMSMSGVTARLEEKLRQNPNDIDGWILLGRSYAALDSSNKAIDLFQEKIDQYPDNINLLVSYGETLTQLNNGTITDEAKDLFLQARSLNNTHPRVEYNLAQYDMQHGQNEQAVKRLKKLLDSAPEKATWKKQILESITLAANKVDLVTKLPDPTPEQMKAANNMSKEDRNAFIRNMVNRLADKLKENPNDQQGWLRLGKSYSVLEEWQKAAHAYQQAMKLDPKDEKIKELYHSALTQKGK